MMNKRYLALGAVSALMILFTSCFTGIENTKKITDKDVAKVAQKQNSAGAVQSVYNDVTVPAFPDWSEGQHFYVVDDNVRRLFQPSSDYDLDTLQLNGRILRYAGYTEGNVLDNEPSVNICFTDGTHTYIYPTKRTISEINRSEMPLRVPFMVDEALVLTYSSLLVGNEFYLRTSIWYDEQGEMVPGRKYIKVKILGVYPGDKVFPLRVKFETFDGEQAFLYMSTKQSSIQNRLFDNLFTTTNPRDAYPWISDEHWQCIISGTLVLDMTKEECRLSLGNPNTIQERPTNDGLQEYWFYTDGMYLVFFDGILKQYRK